MRLRMTAKILAFALAVRHGMMDLESSGQETLPMPTDRSKLTPTQPVSTESPCDVTEVRLTEARRLAYEVEALLVDAAKDPTADAYALRIALGLARSLIDQLVERPISSSRLAASSLSGTGHHGRGGSVRVA
jgi:hypothetical protein